MPFNTTLITRDRLISLYNSGKSMAEIAIILNCSIHKVTYWMTKYDIKRRSRSEASYIKLNPTGDPFKIKSKLSSKDNFLYGLGLGIYWGEGEKVSKNSIRVTNTDPELLRTFIRFVQEICGVKYEKIHYSIVCFNDTDPNIANDFWAKQLTTSREKFGKIVQIPPQGKGSYRRKSQFGVCSVTISNIKLKQWLMQQIKDMPG